MQIGEKCLDQLMEKNRVSWSMLLLKDAQGVECLIEVVTKMKQMRGRLSDLVMRYREIEKESAHIEDETVNCKEGSEEGNCK